LPCDMSSRRPREATDPKKMSLDVVIKIQPESDVTQHIRREEDFLETWFSCEKEKRRPYHLVITDLQSLCD
jgi:hypothetical protein